MHYFPIHVEPLVFLCEENQLTLPWRYSTRIPGINLGVLPNVESNKLLKWIIKCFPESLLNFYKFSKFGKNI